MIRYASCLTSLIDTYTLLFSFFTLPSFMLKANAIVKRAIVLSRASINFFYRYYIICFKWKIILFTWVAVSAKIWDASLETSKRMRIGNDCLSSSRFYFFFLRIINKDIEITRGFLSRQSVSLLLNSVFR